jgi:hypothetical protein
VNKYLLTIYTPEGPTPPPEFLEKVMREVDALDREMKDAGAWVFNGGLHAPSTATVLHLKDDEILMTDGPYLEGKEYVGGFTIIQAPDLDAALAWGRKLARVIPLPIEVRPFVDRAEG